ncbi:MAG: helix-turn-helix domain-containing protein [Thermotaleaceae bacterium]
MTTKGKHLTVEDRNYIEDALNAQYTLTKIAKHLIKDPTTILKGVKRNRIKMEKDKQNEHLSCAHQKQCKRKGICTECCDRVGKKCIETCLSEEPSH